MNKNYVLKYLFVSIFFLAISVSATKERKDEKKIEVDLYGKLELNSNVGDVKVIKSTSNEAHIEVFVKGSEKKVDKFKTDISYDKSKKILKVKGDFDRGIVEKFKFGLFRSSSLEVKFVVSVPEKFISNITTSGGDIVIDSLLNKQVGKTSGGDIRVENCSGEIYMSTSGGNIEVRNLNGKSDLKTSGGDIVVFNTKGNINAKTSGGNLTFEDVEGKIDGETSGGEINVRAKKNEGVNLKTSGGNIRLKLPNDTKANLDASTSFGEVSCSLQFSGEIKKSKIDGKINNGGNKIILKTSGGDIKIEGF